MTTEPVMRVGVILPTKKWTKHGFYSCTRIHFIRLDPATLTAQQLIDDGILAVVHKIVDLLLSAEQEQKLIEELRQWGGVVVDGIVQSQFLCDRRKTCEILRGLTGPIALPTTADCQGGCELMFPLIRKPVAACSVEDSHLMCLYPRGSEAYLESSGEHIIQEFVSHGGILYKCYVIGGELRIQLRPSLTNPPKEEIEPRPFDSQSMKKTGFPAPSDEQYLMAVKRLEPHLTAIEDLTDRLRNELGLSLFGWDLIIEEDTEQLYIIDVNYFPGYDEVDFLNLLCDYLIKVV